MTEEEIKEGVERLAPFHHAIELPHGLSTYVPELARRPLEQVRLPNLKAHAWPPLLAHCGGSLEGLRVLDTGCNCGGFSVEASASGAQYVLGIDVADRYIEQANFVKHVLGLANVEFRKLSVEDLEPDEVGLFQVSLCFGLLYHFENPVLAMKKLAAVTEKVMVVDTSLDLAHPEEPYWRMKFAEAIEPEEEKDVSTALWRSERSCQFTPTARAVENLLGYLGFSSIVRLEPPEGVMEKRYYTGRRVTFLASR